MSRLLATIGIVAGCVIPVMVSSAPGHQQLAIAEKDGAYEVGMPVSRLLLTIPKGQLKGSKSSTGSPGYFMLEDAGRGVVVSGWFEPEVNFKGMPAFWAGERQALSQRGIQLVDVLQERSGKWDTVFYDIVLPAGRSSNVRAEWLQAGTWIDLHLSVTGGHAPAEGRRTLRDTLGTIQVTERTDGALANR